MNEEERPELPEEFYRLLSAWCDGTIDADELQELEAALRRGAAYESAYLAYMDQHAILSARMLRDQGPDRATEAMHAAAFELGWNEGERAVRHSDSRKTHGEDAHRSRRIISMSNRSWIAAACLLLAITLGLIAWPGRRNERKPQSVATLAARPDPSATALATVVKLDGVRWEGPSPSIEGEGAIVGLERFRFTQGAITLAFLSGVTLSVEGPADLELLAIDRVFCRRGKLRARVPQGAEGFVVTTPGSSVVDLGTEFALNVEDGGKAQVMVFEGKAEAAVLGTAGNPERSQLVKPSKAFEIDPGTGDITEAEARAEAFVHFPVLVAPVLSLESSYAEAVRSSRPWGYWRFETKTEDLTPNEIEGRPPLRITGSVEIVATGPGKGNHCAEFADDGKNRFLTLDGLWKPAPDPGFGFELWVMSQDYRHATLVSLLAETPTGMFRHFSLLELTTRGHPFNSRSPRVRFLHRWPPGGDGGLNIYSNVSYVPYRWHHLVSQSNGARMELYIDGVLAHSRPLNHERATAQCQLLLCRLKPLDQPYEHARPFSGRIDEFAVYDRPLSSAEVVDHFLNGSPPISP